VIVSRSKPTNWICASRRRIQEVFWQLSQLSSGDRDWGQRTCQCPAQGHFASSLHPEG